MITNCFEDKILIILESIFIACAIVLFFPYNNMIASFICRATQIPYDLALTVTSIGFGNNIIVLLFTFEIVLVVLFIEKFIPTCIERLVWDY